MTVIVIVIVISVVKLGNGSADCQKGLEWARV